MLGAGLAVPEADAAGPPYSGPQTQPTGPAFFGPAPNPFPYCENPTYFDPFPENVNPEGPIDVTGQPNASVTTDGITLDFELTAEGAPDTQYPGFFPGGGLGDPSDQPKGVEMASGDAASITLSEPLFYTQWVFTDVDRENEGFFVTPIWTAAPGQVALFGGDLEFTLNTSTQTEAAFNAVDLTGHDSEDILGRVQVDMLGAVTGIDIRRDVGSGQSGFAVGGGCEPVGVAKELTSGPTWNGTSFDVTYTIRVRNNLPAGDTIAADIAAAEAAAEAAGRISFLTGTPEGIVLTDLALADLLVDPAFDSVEIVSNESTSGNVEMNDGFDGDGDPNLLAAGETIPAETEEEFVLTLRYVPAEDGPVGDSCAAAYQILNQASVGGFADGVDVFDLSDDGADPDPGANNGAGENDDPTPVSFECPPTEPPPGAPVLELVKSVVAGPQGDCPAFDTANLGDGTPLTIADGDTATYCISVRNTSVTDASNVVIADGQAPADFDGDIGALAAGAEETRSFDLVVTEATPRQNTASATGEGPDGTSVPPVDDTAVIDVPAVPPAQPAISLSKTVLAGADADCSQAVEGVDEFVVGAAGDPITWCFAVTNTGDVALTNVLFTDTPAGIADQDVLEGQAPPVLLVDESVTFALNGSIASGGIDNVASVVGTPSDDNGTVLPDVELVADDNDASVNEAALELEKTVAAGADADCATAVELVTVNAGSTVTYCFTLTNTGGVSVRVLQVDDETLGATVAIPDAEQDIAPGGTVVVSYTTTATGDLVNTASVSGIPIDDDGNPIPNAPVLDAENDAEVDVLEADLSLTKTNGSIETTVPARAVLYTIEIANAGPDPAVNAVMVDTLPAGLSFQTLPDNPEWVCAETASDELTCSKSTPLAAGATETLSYFVRVEATAQVGEPLVNTAAVASDTPDPDPSDNDDTETITVTPPQPPPPGEVVDIVVITNPPGSVSPEPPAAPPTVPAVPPLAVTGASSSWLITAATVMTAVGGVFFVTGRRRADDLR